MVAAYQKYSVTQKAIFLPERLFFGWRNDYEVVCEYR